MNKERIVLMPEQLQITPQEFGELLAVREYLLAGMRHNPEPTGMKTLEGYVLPTRVFNMDKCGVNADCGTVACIGGHMAIIRGMNTKERIDSYVCCDKSKALQPLFFPHDHGRVDIHYRDITPAQAVKAIDNFLATGDARWRDVVIELE